MYSNATVTEADLDYLKKFFTDKQVVAFLKQHNPGQSLKDCRIEGYVLHVTALGIVIDDDVLGKSALRPWDTIYAIYVK